MEMSVGNVTGTYASYQSMELTTVVAESLRMCRLANGPDFFDFTLTGVNISSMFTVLRMKAL